MEKYEDYEEYDYDDKDSVKGNAANDDNYQVVSIISFICTWFIRIGMGLAIILFLVFLITGKILTSFMYIIGLVVAFLFGYGFMFLLDFFFSSKSENN